MKSLITWTVGRRLAAIAAAGGLTALVVGAAALSGASSVNAAAKAQANIDQARALVHQLDTRASELKVDGYKAVTIANPSDEVSELKGDIAEPRGYLRQLAAVQLDPTTERHLAGIKPAFEGFFTEMTNFVNSAVTDQSAAL